MTTRIPSPKPANAARAATNEVVITRVFQAPRPLVFKAWTDPKQLAAWWGPRGFTNPRCEVDVRAGGLIHIDMRAPNGTIYPMSGIYLEIKEPEQIVFTSGALDEKGVQLFEFLHTVTFAESDGKTTLTIHSRVTRASDGAEKYIGGFEAGMTQSLEKLDGHLAQHAEKTSSTSDREIIISRVVSAPRELVWDAMTDPKKVVNWWGPVGFSTTIETMDVRPGGTWKHVMRGPDGTNYPNHSVFKEVVKPERIVYSHGGHKEGGPGISFVCTWTFETVENNKTKVTIHQMHPTAEQRDFVVKEFGAIEGGKQTLGRLDEFVSKN